MRKLAYTGANKDTIGQTEPIGVHADYHNLGLGWVILSENLRCMQLHGVRQIFVKTYSYRNPAISLSEAVGFRIFKEMMVYHKDYLVGYGYS